MKRITIAFLLLSVGCADDPSPTTVAVDDGLSSIRDRLNPTTEQTNEEVDTKVDTDDESDPPPEVPESTPTEPIVEPEPEPSGPIELIEVSGTGAKSSDTFFIGSRSKLQFAWDFKDTTGFGGAFFSAAVHRDSDGRMLELVANENGTGSTDSTIIRLDPGGYYLKINAFNCKWQIKVVQ